MFRITVEQEISFKNYPPINVTSFTFANLMENLLDGTVFQQDPGKNIFSVQNQDGEYIVLELLNGKKPDFADRVYGKIGINGFAFLTNLTTLAQIEVCVKQYNCSRMEALQKTNF